MTLKWIGAIIIFCTCAGIGFCAAAVQKREEKMLRQLMNALNHMEWELQYRLTPLPELCRQAAELTSGNLNALFEQLTTELESQIAPDVRRCLEVALTKCGKLPPRTNDVITSLGQTLGKYDLRGQVLGLAAVRDECSKQIEYLCHNKDVRLRSYQTLGLCVGAALAIIFI